MSSINQELAIQLAQKNANEMELQHVRKLVAENIYDKLIQQSTDELVKQATEAGIEIDQQVILNTAIQLLQRVEHGIYLQTGTQGRCPEKDYYFWKNTVRQVINLLS